MKLRLFYTILVIICPCIAGRATLAAQVTFDGKVVDQNGQRLPYATLFWKGDLMRYSADDSARFQLPVPVGAADTMRVVVAFHDLLDTFVIDDFDALWTLRMRAAFEFKTVEIIDQKSGATISSIQVFKTEIIDRGELRKAACCDLAGCFETQSSVQPQVTNVLTNAKELRILGLSGVYNQVLLDGMPVFNGLSYTYGLAHIPGSMLENIWVVKGANSVVQGYEGMVGQITVWPREGGTAEALTADMLINSFGEKHINAAVAVNKNKWTGYTAFHASLPGNKIDRDDDGFLDIPLLQRNVAYTKWRYRKENENGFSAFIAIRGTNDLRVGGQKDFDNNSDKGSVVKYGQSVDIKQFDGSSKWGYRWRDKHKISVFANAQFHDQNTWIGVLNYQPLQVVFNTIAQYELFYGPAQHNDLKAGVSYRHHEMIEEFRTSSDTVYKGLDSKYRMLEKVPGVFIENTLKWSQDRWTLVAGLRWDDHNSFGGRMTPRMLLRWQPKAAWDFRLSAGYGWRTVRLFAENFNVLSSNRRIEFRESILPEESINSGISLVYKRNIGDWNWTVSADIYYTAFINQFFPNYDRGADVISIENFDGRSSSMAAQLDILLTYNKNWSLRLAYNYLDVYRIMGSDRVQLPYNNRHKLLSVVSYTTKNQKWRFDYNGHWYSRPSLPDVFDYTLVTAPTSYWIGSLQMTAVLRNFECFIGCENLADFRLSKPIIGYQSPFSQNFDTSYIWGPTRGREFYFGVRWKRKNFKKK
jgi:outer membrane receptor for ferrienterochelin and colicins